MSRELSDAVDEVMLANWVNREPAEWAVKMLDDYGRGFEEEAL